jgi:hypothetical protein
MSAKNIVTVTYRQLDTHPLIKINNEEISRYMELSDHIYDDICLLASKLYKGMDDEINDEYDIEICGHRFHYLVINSFKPSSSYCKDVRFKVISETIPVSEKYNFASKLLKKFDSNHIPSCIDLNCSMPGKYKKYNLRNVSFNKSKSKYFLCDESDNVSPFQGGFILKLSDKVACEIKSDSTIICITENELAATIEYLNIYDIQLKCIKKAFDIFNDKKNDLTALEYAEFDAYLNEKIVIYVEDVPSVMEQGDKHKLNYYVFPSSFHKPRLTVQINDSEIARFEGGIIYAQKKGKFELKLIDDKGYEHYHKNISITKHRYIEKINIIAPVTDLKIKEVTTFKCVFQPVDAEDIEDVKYTVSDENVIIISGKNEIYAIGDGKALLTVSSKNISKSIEFDVSPGVKDLIISPQSLMMRLDSRAVISCFIEPDNVTPKPTVKWTSSRSDIIKIITANDYICNLFCNGYGESDITCSVDGTNISKTIRVTTPESTKKCYIATSIYGSYDCPEVFMLRRFRDKELEQTWYGRCFIKVYYALSPILIKAFGKTQWFKIIWEKRLDKLTKRLRAKGYKDTTYSDTDRT